MTQPCLVHHYGEPNLMGYVTCSKCGHAFNLHEDLDDDDDYAADYIDSGDDE